MNRDFMDFCTVIGFLVVMAGIPMALVAIGVQTFDNAKNIKTLWGNDDIDTESIDELERRVDAIEGQLKKNGGE
jgi:hypothetical protein